MSPANHAYLDMKYNRQTKLGQTWAGLVDVNTAYGWNPGAYLSGVGESSVLGVEAPLWTETIVTSADIDYMAFPRLPAIAELGWSPWSTHDVTAFDKSKIKELWSTAAKAWWDSPDDPNIRLLTVTPDDAEFWEGPGKIGTIKMVAAAATSSRPDYGENRKVSM